MSVTITRTAWTDDDGSGTTGTVINNAVKTELYDQIDAALASVLPLAGGTMTGDLKFTDATYDIGKAGATRPRDLFLSRNLVVGGTSTLTGNVVSDLLFTDATYDIGKSGATRPRDGFYSRNVTVGGNLTVVGTGGAIPAANITGSHTLADGALSTNVMLLNGGQTVTSGVWNAGAVTSTGTLTSTASLGLTLTSPNTSDYGSVVSIFNSGIANGSHGAAITFGKSVGAGKSGIMSFVTNATANQGYIAFACDSSSDTLLIRADGKALLPLLADGNLSVASGVITSSSDERLKNILAGPFPYGLEEIRQLVAAKHGLIRYRWNKRSGVRSPRVFAGMGARTAHRFIPESAVKGPKGWGFDDRPWLGAALKGVDTLRRRLAAVEGFLSRQSGYRRAA